MNDQAIAFPGYPTWSEAIDLHDFGREFRRTLGHVERADAQPLEVELVQAEYINARREPPELRIDGYRYTLDQAAELQRLIGEARAITNFGATRA